MGLFGDLVTSALGGFPSKPSVPAAPQLDLQAAQQQSTTGNLAALPGLEDLANATNTFNLGQRKTALNAAIPGYSNLTGSAADTFGNWLTGTLSPDVQSAIQRGTNARSYAGGYGGSGMADNLTARDLGLTSLNLQQAGMSALPGYLSTMYNIGVPPQMSPSSMYTTPGQQLGVNEFNAVNSYENQWLKNQLAALPDPATAAIAKDVGGITDLVAAAALSWAGGVGGGMLAGAGGGALGSSLGAQVGGGSPSYGSMLSGLGATPTAAPGTFTLDQYQQQAIPSNFLSANDLGGSTQTVNPFGNAGFWEGF